MEAELNLGQSYLKSNKFVVADDPRTHINTLEEMEQRLFGYFRSNNSE